MNSRPTNWAIIKAYRMMWPDTHTTDEWIIHNYGAPVRNVANYIEAHETAPVPPLDLSRPLELMDGTLVRLEGVSTTSICVERLDGEDVTNEQYADCGSFRYVYVGLNGCLEDGTKIVRNSDVDPDLIKARVAVAKHYGDNTFARVRVLRGAYDDGHLVSVALDIIKNGVPDVHAPA